MSLGHESMSMASQQPQQVNVSDLELPQLAEVKRQLDDELSHLTNSFAQLRQAQNRFKTCVENVKEVKPQNKDKVILVPLTNSLYVPGKLSDTEHVVIDVGTGYYVKKTRAQAVTHYQDKVNYIKGTLEALQSSIEKKQDNLNYLVNVMQVKMSASQSKS